MQASGFGQREHFEQALAKLTLTFRITGVRNDGHHLVDSEMVTVDLADRLTFSEGEGLQVRPAEGAHGDVVGGVPLDGSDTVTAALRAVGRTAHVLLEKRIPPGAGLGGGSSDAAAVLRWAGETSAEVAVSIGADVPFCLIGGRAWVSGIGERVRPESFVERSFALLTPPFRISTPAAYRTWDSLGGPVGPGTNDLEPAALTLEPRLTRWRDHFAGVTGSTPSLAGSGSSWFVEGDPVGLGLEGVTSLELDGLKAPLAFVHTVPTLSAS